MLVKIHKAHRFVVAVCDSDLIGKVFEDEDGKRVLDLTTTFFQGDEKTAEELKEILEDMRREDACFNIVGRESCEIAKGLGLIEGEAGAVGGVPLILLLL